MNLNQDDFNEYLKHPLLFPPQFKDWVSDWFATNVPKLHVSQVFGFKLYSVHSASAVASITATSAAWTIADPILENLPNGYYLAIFGGQAGSFWGNTNFAHIGLSIDASTAIDTDKAAKLNMGTGGRAAIFDLSSGDGTHSMRMAMTYDSTSTGTATISNPFLHAIRVSTGGQGV